MDDTILLYQFFRQLFYRTSTAESVFYFSSRSFAAVLSSCVHQWLLDEHWSTKENMQNLQLFLHLLFNVLDECWHTFPRTTCFSSQRRPTRRALVAGQPAPIRLVGSWCPEKKFKTNDQTHTTTQEKETLQSQFHKNG